MFTSKNYSFGVLKERVQTAQQELSDGWKNITDKAKKEVKIVNKIARKALATEDGGKLRDGYVTTVNLDAGYDLFKEFQNNWMTIHKESVVNVNKAAEVDKQLNNFSKEWQKWESYLEEFRGNLMMLPDVISKVEIIQNRVESIGVQTQEIEYLLLEYEDACECYELEKCKIDMKVKLSQLVEAKHAEYNLKKTVANKDAEARATIVRDMSIQKIASFPPVTEVSDSKEKQKAYEDAFLDQMNQYIKYGEVEKPIAGSLSEKETVTVEDINIDDSDLSTLREFLGPEEMSSLIEVQASQNKASKITGNEEVKIYSSDVTPSEISINENNCNANDSFSKESLPKGDNSNISEEIESEKVSLVKNTSNMDTPVTITNEKEKNVSDEEGEFFDADNGSDD